MAKKKYELINDTFIKVNGKADVSGKAKVFGKGEVGGNNEVYNNTEMTTKMKVYI